MAVTGAGDMRQVVQFQRRAPVADGYGNTDGPWEVTIPRRAAKLIPTRGGEQVIAQRLQGQSTWDLYVRFDDQTRQVIPGDRVIDLHDIVPGRTFAVRFAQDMDGKRTWLLLQLTLGQADG